jgi:hypothetical protein
LLLLLRSLLLLCGFRTVLLHLRGQTLAKDILGKLGRSSRSCVVDICILFLGILIVESLKVKAYAMGQRRLARCWPVVVPDVVGNEPTIVDKVDCMDCHPHGQ